MTDIAELERRITSALDRIGTGLDGLSLPSTEPVADPAELTNLRELLEAEQIANAQLEERVKSLRKTLEAKLAEVESELSAAKASANEAKNQLQQMRKTNQHLQASLSTLREAAAKGTIEPHLINQAMTSELDGLRAVRAADRAEMDEIMASLKPMLQEAQDA